MAMHFFMSVVIMFVRMCNYMSMGASVMNVCKSVLMQMYMSLHQSICYHKHRSGNHEHKGNDIHTGQTLAEKHKRQERTYERSNGITSTGLCCTERILSTNIQKNA